MVDFAIPDEFDDFLANGVNADDGGYSLAPVKPKLLSDIARGRKPVEADARVIKQKLQDMQKKMSVKANPRRLDETGWGVIFPSDIDPAIVGALEPLLALRKSQAGDRYKVYAAHRGARPGDTKTIFLERHDIGYGPVDPKKVPYYLLLVGGPDRITFAFQQQLDVQYAVGRIAFQTPAEYARYAQSVVTAETSVRLAPRAVLFGVANDDDRSTNLSADKLMDPLSVKLPEVQAEWFDKRPGVDRPQWEFTSIMRKDAAKSVLADMLNSSKPPALLFTASHGLVFPNGSSRQLGDQGALITSDWPGPLFHTGPMPRDYYFSAEDLQESNASLMGSIAFFFACFGAGTPRMDEFLGEVSPEDPEKAVIAPHDFIARLPTKMLSLPRGGALAVVGHVDRTWGASFVLRGSDPQLKAFEDCFSSLLLDGYPVGAAVEGFNERYAEISTELTSELEKIRKFGKKPNEKELARLWMSNNDARNYVVLGDPAVRLQVALPETAPERPVIQIETGDIFTTKGQSILEDALQASPTDAQPAAATIEASTPAHQALKTSLKNLSDQLQGFLDQSPGSRAAAYASDDPEVLAHAPPGSGLLRIDLVVPPGSAQDREQILNALADTAARLAGKLKE